MRTGSIPIAIATAFASMAVVFVLKTFADAVFLGAFGVDYVPHFYVVLAALLMAGSAGYGALLRRGKAFSVDIALLTALAAASLLAPTLAQRGGAWLFATAIALYALPTLSSIALWNAATAAVSGRRSRTFLPRAGAAATLGAVLGGFASSGIIAGWSVHGLAPFAAALTAAALGLRIVLHRRSRDTLAAIGDRTRRQPRALAGHTRKLVWLLAAAAVVEALLSGVLDYGFKREATRAMSPDELGRFFALFYGATNGVILLLQLFATSRVLSTGALRRTLAVQPLALAAVGVGWLALPGLAFATVGRGAEGVLKFGVSRPAQEIALAPLSSLGRQRWKVLLRGVFSQGGSALAGLGLLVLAPALARMEWLVPALLIALAIASLWLGRGVARAYLASLGSALGLQRPALADQRDGARLDREGIERVVELVGDDDAQLSAFGREILTSSDVAASKLADYLGHPAPEVRECLYGLIGAQPDRTALPALRRAVTGELPQLTPEVCAGLAALAAYGDASGVALARELVADHPAISAEGHALAAWSYLAEIGALDDRPDELEAVLESTLRSDGARAAKLYNVAIDRGRKTGDDVDDAIGYAVSNGPVEARRNAMAAAAAIGRFAPLAKLLKALSDGMPGADESFAHLDAHGLFRLVGLVTSRQSPPAVRARLLRALRMSDLPEIADVATTFLTDADADVRDVAARTLLKQVRERDAQVSRVSVEKALAMQLDQFARYVHARPGYGVHARESVMVLERQQSVASSATRQTLFEDEMERRTERELSRVSSLLALLGTAETVYAAERALRSNDFRQRRQAVDVLQEIVRGGQRTRLLELLDVYLMPPSRPSDEARAAVIATDAWFAQCDAGEFDTLITPIAALRSTSLFADVDGEQLVSFAAAATTQTYGDKALIVSAGDPGDALYVVMSGALQIEVDGNSARRLDVGESFGELAILDGRARTATVRAVEPSTLLRLPRDVFTKALESEPSTGLGLVRGLTHWLRGTRLPLAGSTAQGFQVRTVESR